MFVVRPLEGKSCASETSIKFPFRVLNPNEKSSRLLRSTFSRLKAELGTHFHFPSHTRQNPIYSATNRFISSRELRTLNRSARILEEQFPTAAVAIALALF